MFTCLRSIIATFLLLSFCKASADHPLESAIQSLSRLRTQLNNYDSSVGKEVTLKEEIQELQRLSGQLWMKSLLTPLTTTEFAINERGYRLEEVSKPNHVYRLGLLPYATEMRRALELFETKKWDELLKAAKAQRAAIQQIREMTSSTTYSAGFFYGELNTVRGLVGRTRLESLERLLKISASGLDCVSYFRSRFHMTGLLPLQVASERFVWSSKDLLRIYNMDSIEASTPVQRSKIKSELTEMLRQLSKFSISCISVGRAAFIEDELRNLERNVP